MDRAAGISIAVVLGCAAAALAAGIAGAAPERDDRPARAGVEQARPNVIVVMTDDQNDSLDGMPSVRKLLAAHGTTFRNAFATLPLCCPSRATFLTGQYAHNHGVRLNDPENGGGLQGLRGQGNTLPVWLRRAGYRTAHIGKYLNGYGRYRPRKVPNGWDRWFTLVESRGGKPLPGGEQFRYGFTVNRDGRLKRFARSPRNYITDVLRRRAVALAGRWSRGPRPFFLWLTPNNPHGEPHPPGYSRNPRPAPRHEGIYAFEPLPAKASINEADVSDKPESVRSRPLIDQAVLDDLELRHRSRLESVISVDEMVAALVKRLKRRGELRRTVIVFTSDNGLLLGEHRLIFKGVLYEEAIRVPLIISGPGFPDGVTRRQIVGNVDLAPTIVSIAGATPRRRLDGRALGELAREGRLERKRIVLLETPGGAVGLRTPRYAYFEHPTGEVELYDLRADPLQLQSRHAGPPYADVRARLARRLDALRGCRGSGCRRMALR